MNKLKYFDKYQFIIGITTIASLIISIILFIVMVVTATPIYDENGALINLIYNNIIQTIFTIFFFLQLTAVVWFIARTITYKMRVKEEDI